MKPWIRSSETINENERLNERVMQEVQGCGHKSNTKIKRNASTTNIGQVAKDEVIKLMSW